MKEKIELMAYIFITPFVVSASIEFLPTWLSWPISMLGAMTWIGALLMLQERKNDSTKNI